jgi:hypothetical protein
VGRSNLAIEFSHPPQRPVRMSVRRALSLMLCFGLLVHSGVLRAAESVATVPGSRILKVLPHLVDAEGRVAQAPSLFQRDAYQAHLRKHPEKVSTQRFDVHCKVFRRQGTDLKLRLTLRTANRAESNPLVLEAPLKSGLWGRAWQSLALDPEAYRAAGKVVAWRMEMLENEAVISTQASFLW